MASGELKVSAKKVFKYSVFVKASTAAGESVQTNEFVVESKCGVGSANIRLPTDYPPEQDFKLNSAVPTASFPYFLQDPTVCLINKYELLSKKDPPTLHPDFD